MAFDFSTTPTANPARSYSPGTNASGMLGGLAADERAARLLAAGGDALDDVGGDVDVEPLAHEVVEEEQRLGALHEDVVDAHRDEVDADRVVAVERERELELGAHAVGAGDEHRLPVALRSSTSAPKPPMPASTSGRIVRFANGLMRSTSASPASMSTPASR